jgi:hypothetical protein
MITNSPVIQLFMVVLAAAIVLLYIKPTVTDIRATQDQIGIYNYELERVTGVNTLLNEHVNAIEALPLSSVQALERYMPSTIDEIAVMRDLQTLVEDVGVRLTGLEYMGALNDAGDGSQAVDEVVLETPTKTSFRLSAEASYDQVKELLRAIEINNYQLTIERFDITPAVSYLAVDMSLTAYSLNGTLVPTE